MRRQLMTSDLHTRRLSPDPEGTGTQQAMVHGSQEVTTDTKEIQHDALHRQESLESSPYPS